MIFSSDREFTLRPAPGTQMTVDLAGTSIRLPVVGGPLAMPICDNPDTRSTVLLGDTNTRVPNRQLAGTCTINDHILDDADWASHGAFVSHVSGVADLLVEGGFISGREHGLLSSAAARTKIGAE